MVEVIEALIDRCVGRSVGDSERLNGLQTWWSSVGLALKS